MGRSARRLAAVGLLVVVLAGCRIDVVLHDQDPLPGGLKWEAEDVEMLPNGQFVGGGCLFSLGSPGLGVVVFAPDATVLRVLSTCSSIQSGSLGVATTVDGTIYFGRSREIVPFEEYRYELVRIPPGGAASDGVVVHSATTGDPFTLQPFIDPVVSPDGSIVLVRSGDPDNPGVFTVTGPTKRKLRPGTEGLSPLDGFEVRNSSRGWSRRPALPRHPLTITGDPPRGPRAGSLVPAPPVRRSPMPPAAAGRWPSPRRSGRCR